MQEADDDEKGGRSNNARPEVKRDLQTTAFFFIVLYG